MFERLDNAGALLYRSVELGERSVALGESDDMDLETPVLIPPGLFMLLFASLPHVRTLTTRIAYLPFLFLFVYFDFVDGALTTRGAEFLFISFRTQNPFHVFRIFYLRRSRCHRPYNFGLRFQICYFNSYYPSLRLPRIASELPRQLGALLS